eukprot:610499-Karenia_brevis.AAC.1
MAMEIQEQRNTDHDGALPLYMPLVGENYDLKQMMQFITKTGTDLSAHTWAQVAQTRIIHERIG